MKQLSFGNIGVHDLDARELKETDGGILVYLISKILILGSIAVVAGAIAYSFESGKQVACPS